jgi:hypothetical protein
MAEPKIEGGKCEYCGATLIRNPKTGKIFCEKKCWLNKDGASPQPVPKGNSYGKKSVSDYKAMILRYAVDMEIANHTEAQTPVDMERALQYADKMIAWFKGEKNQSQPATTPDSPIDGGDELPF